jgi:hypothetical protein
MELQVVNILRISLALRSQTVKLSPIFPKIVVTRVYPTLDNLTKFLSCGLVFVVIVRIFPNLVSWDHAISYRRAASQIATLCYLTDTDVNNAALRVLPGSHLKSAPIHAILPEAHGHAAEQLESGHAAMSDLPNQMTLCMKAEDAVAMDCVARLPTTMAMLGKPMIAQTWSEIFVGFSSTIGWLICANALVAASAARARSAESDFIASLILRSLILRSFAICSDPPLRPCLLHCMPDTAADRELPPYCGLRRPRMRSAWY